VVKKIAKRKHNSLHAMAMGIDFLLQGGNTFCTPDFIMRRNSYQETNKYPIDNDFIETLEQLKAHNNVIIPNNLVTLKEEYRKQRTELGNYQEKADRLIVKHEKAAAKELGNFDTCNNKPIIGNNAELNVFLDYIMLYPSHYEIPCS
jgi:hypothetical protein